MDYKQLWLKFKRIFVEPFKRINNYFLVKRYPFLGIQVDWGFDMEYHKPEYKYRYEWTWLDSVPIGWRPLLLQMCKKLKKIIKENNLTNYKIHQVKEKYGELCWYDEGGNKRTFDLISEYENKTGSICVVCGKPAKYYTKGWINYYCPKCIKKLKNVRYGTL